MQFTQITVWHIAVKVLPLAIREHIHGLEPVDRHTYIVPVAVGLPQQSGRPVGVLDRGRRPVSAPAKDTIFGRRGTKGHPERYRVQQRRALFDLEVDDGEPGGGEAPTKVECVTPCCY